MHPRYNGVTVLELTRLYQPETLYLASYSPQELGAQRWRDQNELSFFHVLPWAERVGLAVVALDEAEDLRRQALEFRQALEQYPRGQEFLRRAAPLEEALQRLLTEPMTPERLAQKGTIEALQAYHQGYVRLFGDGPATGFRSLRMRKVAERLSSPGRAVVLVDVLDYPLLIEALPEGSYRLPQAHAPTEFERWRSLLDRAWRLSESDDWGLLLEGLQAVKEPEALYCAAQIYLAAGQPEDALVLLEELLHTDFHHPAYLPGYALARYGQLADALGQRERALRAYQAVLGLSWAPAEAREIALAGQRTPFRLGSA
ncbi:MAG: hypothetical protein D6684_05985 [Deinococcus-Thermus bacterium]|nr:MAG: hypothetical protein D6684_05985 [Deinococcota bacterium]